MLRNQHHYGDVDHGKSTPIWRISISHRFGDKPRMAVNRLREFREARKLSQARLGDLAGTSSQQIDRLEKAQRKLTVQWAEKLAPHLGVEPLDIFTDGEIGATGPWVPSPQTIADLLATAMLVDEEDQKKLNELQIVASAFHTGLQWIADNPESEADPGFLKGVRIRIREAISAAKKQPSKVA